MDKRTKENLLYVGEGLMSQFGKPVFLLSFLLMVAAGIVWGFQKVDAYLTPSYIKTESRVERIEARIVISKIGVDAPITFVESEAPADFLKPLKNGVAHYPSALPGEKGVSIILGHSAPFGWFGNEYDDVFSNLKDLEQGDQIIITSAGKIYAYEVSGKLFLQRGQDIPRQTMQSDRPRLVLLSCWPPGINNKRIMVQAEII